MQIYGDDEAVCIETVLEYVFGMFRVNLNPIRRLWMFNVHHDDLASWGLVVGHEVEFGAFVVNVVEVADPFGD